LTTTSSSQDTRKAKIDDVRKRLYLPRNSPGVITRTGAQGAQSSYNEKPEIYSTKSGERKNLKCRHVWRKFLRIFLPGFPTKSEREKQDALAQNSSSAEQRMHTRTSESAAAAAVWWFKLIMIILFRQRREYPELQKTAASHKKDNRGPEITDLALQKRTDSGREERLGIENVKTPAPHTSGRKIQTREFP
jgi:hypothetical protein